MPTKIKQQRKSDKHYPGFDRFSNRKLYRQGAGNLILFFSRRLDPIEMPFTYRPLAHSNVHIKLLITPRNSSLVLLDAIIESIPLEREFEIKTPPNTKGARDDERRSK
jgi:hypothetical protein